MLRKLGRQGKECVVQGAEIMIGEMSGKRGLRRRQQFGLLGKVLGIGLRILRYHLPYLLYFTQDKTLDLASLLLFFDATKAN